MNKFVEKLGLSRLINTPELLIKETNRHLLHRKDYNGFLQFQRIVFQQNYSIHIPTVLRIATCHFIQNPIGYKQHDSFVSSLPVEKYHFFRELFYFYCKDHKGLKLASDMLLKSINSEISDEQRMYMIHLIKECIKHRDLSVVNSLYRNYGNLQLATLFFQAYASIGSMDQVDASFKSLLDQGHTPDSFVLNILVQALVRRSRIDDAKLAIEKFQSQFNVPASIHTIVSLMTGIAKNTSFPMDDALEYMKNIPTPNQHVYHVLIDGYLRRRNLALAKKYFALMIKNYSVDKYTYSIMKRGLLRMGEDGRIWFKQVFGHSITAKQRPSEPFSQYSNTILLDYQSLDGNNNKIIKSLENAKDVVYFTTILRKYIEKNDLDNAMKVYRKFLESGLNADQKLFSQLLEISARFPNITSFDETLSILGKMISQGVYPNDPSYKHLITITKEKANPQYMISIVDYICDLETPLYSKTLHEILDALTSPKTCRNYHIEQALKILEIILKNYSLNLDSFYRLLNVLPAKYVTPLLDILAKFDAYHHILELFKSIDLDNVTISFTFLSSPEAPMFKIILQVVEKLAQEKNYSKIVQLWRKILQDKYLVHPNLVCAFLEHLNNENLVRQLWQFIIEKGRPSIPRVTEEMMLSFCKCLISFGFKDEAIFNATFETFKMGIPIENILIDEMTKLVGSESAKIKEFWSNRGVSTK